MAPILKAEFRKLFTIRSTYFIAAACFVLIVIFSFYGEGIKGAGSVYNPEKITSLLSNMVGLLSFFSALIAIFLITHEYRFNMIMYTLTAVNSRAKVLIAKLIAVFGFTILFLVMGVGIALASVYSGLNLAGLPPLVAQHIDVIDLGWRIFYYALAYSLFGLLLGFLFRNVVASISVLFLLPTVEQLMTFVLKDNVKYLPNMSLSQVIPTGSPVLSPGKAAFIFGIYLVVGWAVAWYLFEKRDAN